MNNRSYDLAYLQAKINEQTQQIDATGNAFNIIKKLLMMAKDGSSTDTIRNQGLEMIQQHTQSKGGYLHFFNEFENAIDLVCWSEAVVKICDAEKTIHYPLEDAGIWADAARQRKTVVHNDYQSIPDKNKGGLPEGHFPLYRHMSIPIFDHDKLVAILGVGNKEKAYSQSDIEIAEVLSDMLWSVLVQRKAHEVLEKYSFEDGLTGLANRRRFNEILASEWDRARRNQNQIAMLMIDIDYFKEYNDTFGHTQGDICLTQVARALQKSFRRAGEVVARYGGEEFAVIIPNTSQDKAKKTAHQAIKSIRDLKIPHPASEVFDFVTVSIGVSVVLPGDNEYSRLIELSDKNLYEAKAKGRNQIVVI